MTLCGHIHFNWLKIHTCGNHQVWSISTEALKDRGYIRIFKVYPEKIEVTAYSPWKEKNFSSPLDRFTIIFDSKNKDIDGDYWENSLDVMPTHPFAPNGIILMMSITIISLLIKIHN